MPTHTICLSTVARRLEIGTDSAAVAAFVARAFARMGAREGPAAPSDYAFIRAARPRGLTFNGRPVPLDDPLDRDERLAFYGSSRAVRESVAADPGRRIFYGAAIEIGGRAVLIAAPSGTGKTTLVLNALARGARLYGDEFVPVRRDDARVDPLIRTFMVREPGLPQIDDPRVRAACTDAEAHRSSEGWRYWHFIDPVAIYGEQVVARPAPLGGVVILEPSPHRGAAALVPLSRTLAAVALSKRLRSDRAGLDRIGDLADLIAGSRVYRLVAGDAGCAADTLMRAFA